MEKQKIKVIALIVTYNRIEDLIKSLETYKKQIVKPDAIVIVNNNSTDGTRDFLDNWKSEKEEYEKYIINLNENLGGSGGFYEGLKFAMDKEYDWIWLHDDDAFLEEDCIKRLKEHIDENKKNEISAICSKVIDNGKIQIYHRRNFTQGIVKVKEEVFAENIYQKNYFEINAFSYVGVAINKEKLKEVGLTNKDLFIHHDDIEHSYRLSKVGKILCYPDITVYHNTKTNNETKTDWKLYYTIRNQLYFFKNYFRKSSYYYEYIHLYCLAVYKKYIKKDIVTQKLLLEALKDARNNKLGKHSLYIPGWKPEIKKEKTIGE